MALAGAEPGRRRTADGPGDVRHARRSSRRRGYYCCARPTVRPVDERRAGSMVLEEVRRFAPFIERFDMRSTHDDRRALGSRAAVARCRRGSGSPMARAGPAVAADGRRRAAVGLHGPWPHRLGAYLELGTAYVRGDPAPGRPRVRTPPATSPAGCSRRMRRSGPSAYVWSPSRASSPSAVKLRGRRETCGGSVEPAAPHREDRAAPRVFGAVGREEICPGPSTHTSLRAHRHRAAGAVAGRRGEPV